MRAAMTGSWRPIDILLAGTGAGVAVCAFLPWAQISAGFLSVTKTGYDGDGQFTLILGLLVILAVVVFVYGKLAEWAMLLAALICGGFIAGIGMIDWIDLESRRSDLGDTASIVDVSVGIGLVLTVVGGFV